MTKETRSTYLGWAEGDMKSAKPLLAFPLQKWLWRHPEMRPQPRCFRTPAWDSPASLDKNHRLIHSKHNPLLPLATYPGCWSKRWCGHPFSSLNAYLRDKEDTGSPRISFCPSWGMKTTKYISASLQAHKDRFSSLSTHPLVAAPLVFSVLL